MSRRLWVLLFILLIFSAQSASAAVPLIVQLSGTALLNDVLTFLGGVVVDAIPGAGIYLINAPQLPTNTLLFSALGIQWIEYNNGVALGPVGQFGVLRIGSSAAADWYRNQPAMLLTHSQNALSVATGRGVVIADINSLVDYSHPALQGHLGSGYDFVSSAPSGQTALNQSGSDFLDQSGSDFLDQSGSDFLDRNGATFLGSVPLLGANPAYSHATLCAGIVAVSAPDAMIMPLRAFDTNGSSDDFMLAKAIRYAVDHGAAVVNMSFGTLLDSNAIHSSINYALAHGVLLIASAGNNNGSTVQYPAGYAGVTSVSATDLQDVKSSFSNYGSYVTLDAPGVNIISAYPSGMYAVVSGTSFSAAMVSATAALARSITATNVMASISSTAVNIDSKNPQYVHQLGAGRINVMAAAQVARQTNVAPVTITSIGPDSTTAGGPAITLTVNGTNFLTGSAVQWNGSPLPTTFVSTTQLTAQLDSSWIANAGNATLTVVSPGASPSNGVPFTILASPVSNLQPVGTLTQVASGGGWKTTITLINLSPAAVSARIDLFGNDGKPLTLPLTFPLTGNTLATSSATLNIGPNSSVVVESEDPGRTISVGWAEVEASQSLSGYAIFRLRSPGVPDSEGTVSLENMTSSSLAVPFDNTGGSQTGVALSNATGTPSTISATLLDQNGVQIASSQVGLPAFGHMSFFVGDLFPQSFNRLGVIQFQNSAGAMGGLGLRFNRSGSFTSLPIVP